MSSLHSLHLTSSTALQRAISSAQGCDALLLREDAVLLAMSLPAATSIFSNVYALAADVTARGLQSRLPAVVSVIEEADFVALSLQHDRVIAWT